MINVVYNQFLAVLKLNLLRGSCRYYRGHAGWVRSGTRGRQIQIIEGGRGILPK
jgi:hypothetical protein